MHIIIWDILRLFSIICAEAGPAITVISALGRAFLISLKAGGTGLNLTSANTVVHLDPWWNSSVENQASDRAHRIGQKQVVEVIKLIAKGTIEEKIIELQERKKDLIDNMINENLSNANMLSSISEEEIIYLLQ